MTKLQDPRPAVIDSVHRDTTLPWIHGDANPNFIYFVGSILEWHGSRNRRSAKTERRPRKVPQLGKWKRVEHSTKSTEVLTIKISTEEGNQFEVLISKQASRIE